MVKISVEDSGIGIPENLLGGLFRAFGKVQTKEHNEMNTQGVGLGLNISNQLAGQLNQNKDIDDPTQTETAPILNKGLNV